MLNDNIIECCESSHNDGKKISIFKELKAFLLNLVIILESKNTPVDRSSGLISATNGANDK